ncbi:MAG TPA: hypothetical protein VL688_11565 [Verrucomicrobiae bacterium]|jgi:hypothetical protein|nr:hypothetical protein [Verrucomicrobiae bacterium]
MKPVFWAVVVSLACLSLSCKTMEQERSWPTLYEKYDLYATELQHAVERGEMTISEAETLRQEAYRGYLKDLEKQQILAEHRNY